MKRTLLVLLTLALCLSFTSGALAAGVKVPKSACFRYQVNPLTLTITAAGKVTTADGQVPFYKITGAYYLTPITGSGYVVGSTFKFTLSASFKNIPFALSTFLFSGKWDLTAPRIVDNPVGEITHRITGNSIQDETAFPLLWADCTTQHVE